MQISYFVLFTNFYPQGFAKAPIQVFILAGQSNMEGKGGIDPLLNHQIQATETKDFFAHLHKDGDYIERDDVWIDYLGRRGNLTVGYGSPGKIGPELEFGNTMGGGTRKRMKLFPHGVIILRSGKKLVLTDPTTTWVVPYSFPG